MISPLPAAPGMHNLKAIIGKKLAFPGRGSRSIDRPMFGGKYRLACAACYHRPGMGAHLISCLFINRGADNIKPFRRGGQGGHIAPCCQGCVRQFSMPYYIIIRCGAKKKGQRRTGASISGNLYPFLPSGLLASLAEVRLFAVLYPSAVLCWRPRPTLCGFVQSVRGQYGQYHHHPRI